MGSFEVATIQELPKVVSAILRQLPPRAIVLLSGDMGVGKTTFVSEVARQLKMSTPASSPTYAIHQQYSGPTQTMEHFDLYRLESEDDVETSGLWDVLASASGATWVMIEWPERVTESHLPKNWDRFLLKFKQTGDVRQLLLTQL
jgi:tRNA threonylcarbamoyladenosine biosynthesis protein TsaE